MNEHRHETSRNSDTGADGKGGAGNESVRGDAMAFRMALAKRRGSIEKFSWKDNLATRLTLIALFLLGLYISAQWGLWASVAYVLLWVASDLVLFAGTCRRCAYYGRSCPIPLEGSIVCRVIPKSEKPFTGSAILYASIAYVLRVGLPVGVILQDRLVFEGILLGLIFILFWVSNLLLSGCPNCINYPCPLNPGKGK